MPSAAALGRKGLLLPSRSGARCPCGCNQPTPCFCADGETPLPQCCCAPGGCTGGEDCETPCAGQPNPCRCFDGRLLPDGCCQPGSPIYNQQGPGQPCDCGACCQNKVCACGNGATANGTATVKYEGFQCCNNGSYQTQNWPSCVVTAAGTPASGACSNPGATALIICSGFQRVVVVGCNPNQPYGQATLPFQMIIDRASDASFRASAGTVGFLCTGSLGSCSGGSFQCTRQSSTTCGNGSMITAQNTEVNGSVTISGCQACRSNASQLAFDTALRSRQIRASVRVSGLRDASPEQVAAALAGGGCSGCGGGAGLTRRLA